MAAFEKNSQSQNTVAQHSRAARAQHDFDSRCKLLRQRLTEEDFLSNKGIGNEVGFFTFCYDPSLELQARAFFSRIADESKMGKLPCTVKAVNLYDAFIQILEEKRILKAVPKQELKTGTAKQLKQLQKIASPEVFVKKILELTQPHEYRDVIIVTGVGEVYPFCRAHDLLNNMQADFADVPVVIAYPGTFNGREFRLFSTLKNDNYYRAFDLSEEQQ